MPDGNFTDQLPGKAEIHFNIILPVIPLVIADQIGADLIRPLCRIRLLKGLTPFGFPDEFHPVKPISKQSVSKLVLSYYVNRFYVNNKNFIHLIFISLAVLTSGFPVQPTAPINSKLETHRLEEWLPGFRIRNRSS